MTKQLKLSEAAADILGGNVAAKRSGQDSFGLGKKLNPAAVAQGEVEINAKAVTSSQDANPDYTKGTPTATPPGATPPVGSEKDGVGATKPQGQPQETQGRSDVATPTKTDATDYEKIRDRVKYSAPAQTFHANEIGRAHV